MSQAFVAHSAAALVLRTHQVASAHAPRNEIGTGEVGSYKPLIAREGRGQWQGKGRQ